MKIINDTSEPADWVMGSYVGSEFKRTSNGGTLRPGEALDFVPPAVIAPDFDDDRPNKRRRFVGPSLSAVGIEFKPRGRTTHIVRLEHLLTHEILLSRDVIARTQITPITPPSVSPQPSTAPSSTVLPAPEIITGTLVPGSEVAIELPDGPVQIIEELGIPTSEVAPTNMPEIKVSHTGPGGRSTCVIPQRDSIIMHGYPYPYLWAMVDLENKILGQAKTNAAADRQAALFVQLLLLAAKPASQRSGDEQICINWLANEVKQNRIAAAKIALREYNRWRVSPGSYTAPPGFAPYEYGSVPHSPLEMLFTTPDPPPVQSYGALAYQQLTVGEGPRALDATARALKNVSIVVPPGPQGTPPPTIQEAIALGVGVAVAGGVGAGVGAGVASTPIILGAILPYMLRAVQAGSIVGGVIGVGAATGVAIFAMVATAIITAVFEGIAVQSKAELHDKLTSAVSEAERAALPDIHTLVKTSEGMNEALLSFMRAAISNN